MKPCLVSWFFLISKFSAQKHKVVEILFSVVCVLCSPVTYFLLLYLYYIIIIIFVVVRITFTDSPSIFVTLLSTGPQFKEVVLLQTEQTISIKVYDFKYICQRLPVAQR